MHIIAVSHTKKVKWVGYKGTLPHKVITITRSVILNFFAHKRLRSSMGENKEYNYRVIRVGVSIRVRVSFSILDHRSVTYRVWVKMTNR